MLALPYHWPKERIRPQMTPSLADLQTPSSTTAAAQTKAAAQPETTQAQRSEVHRKLGRCLVRLQQYEMLTKAMLVDHQQSGSLADWDARRQARIAMFAKKTLGQLVEWMKDSYLTPDEGREVASDPPTGSNQIWFSFRSAMHMDPDSYQRTVEGMEELVELRNNLVHHLLEQFNLWTLDGCAAADSHLEKSYDLIDRHVVELVEWARHMDQARQAAATFMASDEYVDHVQSHRAQPDQAVLPLHLRSPIVECLREAEAFLAVDGWVLLDDAIAFIGRVDPEQNPTRYGRKNWRQVLRDSGAFEFARQAVSERAGLYTVYRTSAKRPVS